MQRQVYCGFILWPPYCPHSDPNIDYLYKNETTLHEIWAWKLLIKYTRCFYHILSLPKGLCCSDCEKIQDFNHIFKVQRSSRVLFPYKLNSQSFHMDTEHGIKELPSTLNFEIDRLTERNTQMHIRTHRAGIYGLISLQLSCMKEARIIYCCGFFPFSNTSQSARQKICYGAYSI